jgi:peptidyl-tRNA hydrolase
MLTLILGLGNIGRKYEHTRHNLGFEVMDRVVEELGAVRQEKTDLYEWWRVEIQVEDGQTGASAAHGHSGPHKLDS